MILADSSMPTGQELLSFFGCTAFILGIAVSVKKLLEKPPVPTPQPLRVKTDHDFVTTVVHDKAILEIKQELQRHAGRRAEIYETQKEQGAALAALDEKTDLMNAQLVRQEGKIDRILERLPRSTS